MNINTLTAIAGERYITGRTDLDSYGMREFGALVTVIAMLTGETEFVVGRRIELANIEQAELIIANILANKEQV